MESSNEGSFERSMHAKSVEQLLVALWNGMSRDFSDIGREIRDTLLDTQHHNGADHWNPDAGHHSESHSADELVLIAKILLEGVDGEQGEILFLLSIAQDVDVNQLSDFETL